MSMEMDDVTVGKRLFVGNGLPEILGRGDDEVRGTSYTEGPSVTGDPTQYYDHQVKTPIKENQLGTVMIGETQNSDMQGETHPVPFYSLFVRTYARIRSYLKVDELLTVRTIKSKVIYAETIMARVKNFVIPHPSKPGRKLVHACLEGPENGVFCRGRLTGTSVIYLPEYWVDLVEELSITVQLQPIGAHQDIIIKRVGQNKVFLQSKGGMPIDCYYHIFAERKDVPRLKIEE